MHFISKPQFSHLFSDSNYNYVTPDKYTDDVDKSNAEEIHMHDLCAIFLPDPFIETSIGNSKFKPLGMINVASDEEYKQLINEKYPEAELTAKENYKNKTGAFFDILKIYQWHF